MQREKRLRDDPLADLLGPLFVGCKRCGTKIKLSPKSSYDPFHWVKHRERCLRRSIEAVQEILRENVDQATRALSAKSPQQHNINSGAAVIDATTQLTVPPRPQARVGARAPSPSPSSSLFLSSPSLERRCDVDLTTPSLTADEDDVDKLSHSSSRSDQRDVPDGQEEDVPSESDISPGDVSGEVTPPLCSLSVFRAPDMLAFEDYLHRSRRLPTRLGFPELLPSPDKWHDWSWGQLRAPVYVVSKRPAGTEGTPRPVPPLPSHGDAGDGILQSEERSISDSFGNIS